MIEEAYIAWRERWCKRRIVTGRLAKAPVRTSYIFHQPPGGRFRQVRIVSRNARVLGVAVRSGTVPAGTRRRTIDADDDRLAEGFHGYEPELCIRWTDGDALLPVELFEGFDDPAELVFQVAGTTRYIATTECQEITA
jgi:hypothetical protein